MALAVSVNGSPMPATILLTQPDGQLSARTSDLQRWRFSVAGLKGTTQNGESHIRLDAIPGLSWRIEPSTQTLVLESSAGNFQSTVLGRDARSLQPPPAPYGGFLNYDLSAQRVDRRTSTGGLFDVVGFGPRGSLSSGVLARGGATGGEQRAWVRLNSTWTLDRPLDTATWRLGDTVSHGGSWSRPVRLGGLQYATNFGTQPGFITFPMPSLSGEAALPSTVDIYVNDALRTRRNVLAGPFSVPELPVVTGMGEARVVVRDLLGREQTVLTPFYASPLLLKPGLRDFSYEVGAVRSNYGLKSADYGELVAIGTERRGLTDRLTGELHGEVSRDRQAAGVGATWLWPAAGVFSASSAFSNSERGRGALVAAGFQRQARGLSFGGNLSATSRRFMPLGSVTDPAAALRQIQSYVSYATPAYGAFGMNYVRQDFRERPGAELAGASWGFTLGSLGYLSMTLLRDLKGRDARANLSFSRLLGRNTSLSASATLDADSRSGHVQVQRNLPVGTGVGYRLAAASGDVNRADGTLLLQNDDGTYTADVSTRGGRTAAYRAGVAGGIAMIGSKVFASRTISESFSVVDVPGFPDVRVYAANQLIGRTGASGTMLVPRLLPYQTNQIRIEQADLPMDATVGALSVDVVPHHRSGVLVPFPVRRSRTALITVLLDDGAALPAGTIARLRADEEGFPSGQRGELYLTGLGNENTVELTWRDQHCVIQVPFQQTPDPQPHLGSFVCHGVRR
jgi:outer membrane usher protein